MGSNAQQYCLRWNNHRSNLLTVFDELLQNEAFTDVTLVCEGGSPIKCHRMVLAACSPYFQNLFTDLPCKHPVVVLKDVKYIEIKAILEYMYRGEVNVAQDQLAALLKIAEALKVKGLVEENRSGEKSGARSDTEQSQPGASPSSTNNQSTVHSSSNNSPPHSTNGVQYKNPYLYGKPPSMERSSSRSNVPMWTVPRLPLPHHTSQVPQPNHPHAAVTAAAAMLSSCYEAGSPDMNPLKRKKLSSLLMNRDTPILRTVLGQADSSQPVSLVCHSNSNPDNVNSNGIEEQRSSKHIKNEPSEDAQSPYTELSMMDDDEKPNLGIPSSSPHGYSGDMRGMSGIATYVPSNQKPEWKRYKQYTRDDIMSAIEAVRNGMSALQAARLYKVPSRTLYDKVKKLGITTSRPFKRGSNGTNACFPYGISGTSSPFGHLESEEHSMNNNSALLEASSILQHALDSRGGDEREALAAMAAAAAAHAAMSSHNTSPNNNSHARSPSPSPTLLKYMRLHSLTPSPALGSEHNHSETNGSSEREREEEDDQVEDLSVGRKQESRVIMPPMSMSSIIKKEEMLKETLREEMRREQIKNEPSEDSQSPYTDLSMIDDDDKSNLDIQSSSPLGYSGDIYGISGLATYIPNNQKLECRRYKQYSRNNIMSALESVRNGMTALQASKLYNIPSRTLYDKAKKLGITSSRSFKRCSNGSNRCYPYGISGTNSLFGHLELEEHNMNNNSDFLAASSILQHALDKRGGDERDALAAMATAAAVHATMSSHNTSPNNNSNSRSPNSTPVLSKCLPPPPGLDIQLNHIVTNDSSGKEHEEEENQVEDLSIGRKEESQAIIPPMSISSIIKKEEMLKEMLREEICREVSVDNTE